MELALLNFQHEVKDIHKAFKKPLVNAYSIKNSINHYLKKGIAAGLVPDNLESIVSLFHPEYNIRGYVKFKEDRYRIYHPGNKETVFPEYILLKVSKAQFNIWKDYLRKDRDYDIQEGNSFFATQSNYDVTLSFYKYFFKGCYIIIGSPNFNASKVKI